MEKHVTAVGILQIGMAVLGILVAAIVLIILVGTGFLVLYTEGEGLHDPPRSTIEQLGFASFKLSQKVLFL